MKHLITMIIILTFVACKQAPEAGKAMTNDGIIPEKPMARQYPEAMVKVFAAHGGLEKWKRYKTLVFQIPATESKEKHTVDLYTRKDRIETDTYSMGMDGDHVWLHDTGNTYKGNPNFYHNLMFYFFSMPFVLADEGISFSDTSALEFEGKSYPGLAIAFGTDVGASPQDEYFIHYDPKTNQMAWLGYTVTYQTGKKSDSVNWIRYDDWKEVGGLQLPGSLTWYTHKDRQILQPKSTVHFDHVRLDMNALSESFFKKPANATIVSKDTLN